MDGIRVATIIGSTRPGRNGRAIGEWFQALAETRNDAEYELVDLETVGLPLLDEPAPASQGNYAHAHTREWASVIDGFDAFVFITPEYNHGTSAALKNALDFLFAEWRDKAAGFVSYGAVGGVRAVEHLRLVLAELGVATVRPQVAISLFTDFGPAGFAPAERHEGEAHVMLDQVVRWGEALRDARLGARHHAG